jgi:predicted RNase H-like nuclease
VEYASTQYPYLQGIMGLDPGWGVSSFGIVIVHFVDGLIRVSYVDEHTRSDHSEMLSVVSDLIQLYNVTKVLVDASAPSFIRALKLEGVKGQTMRM